MIRRAAQALVAASCLTVMAITAGCCCPCAYADPTSFAVAREIRAESGPASAAATPIMAR